MDESELQRRYPIAFFEGSKARLRGKDLDANPHTIPCSPIVRTEFHAWESGFINTLPYERRTNEI